VPILETNGLPAYFQPFFNPETLAK